MTYELNGEIYDKFTVDNIIEMYIKNQKTKVTMHHRLQKNKYNLNSTQRIAKMKQFTIHGCELVRSLFNTDYNGRILDGNNYLPRTE